MARLKSKGNSLLEYSEMFGFFPNYEYEPGVVVKDIETVFRDVQEPVKLLNDAIKKRFASAGIPVDEESIQAASVLRADSFRPRSTDRASTRT